MSECVLCVYISGIVLHAPTNLSPRSSVAASSRRRHCCCCYCCYCWCCVCSILIFYVCKRAKNRKLYNKTCQLVSQSGRQASRQPRVCICKTWIIYLLIKFAATEWVSEWEREREKTGREAATAHWETGSATNEKGKAQIMQMICLQDCSFATKLVLLLLLNLLLILFSSSCCYCCCCCVVIM